MDWVTVTVAAHLSDTREEGRVSRRYSKLIWNPVYRQSTFPKLVRVLVPSVTSANVLYPDLYRMLF